MQTNLPLKLTTEQVYRLLTTDPQCVVIYDCRDYAHYEADHLAGSHWYPITQIEQALEKDFGEKILVLICDYERSTESLLLRKEVDHVVILAGGFEQWVSDGYPTIKLPNNKLSNENRLTGKES